MRISVVDDNRSVRESLVAILQTENHETDGFASAEAFLASAPKAYDCLLVDYSLTGATGCELVKALRQKENDVPAIIISGNLSADIVEQTEGLGNVSVLRKPCLARTIIKTVNELVDNCDAE